jgi:beta-alanine degradation protein BauB
MVTLIDFDRRLTIGDQVRDVSLRSGQAAWLPAQTHLSENVGPTPTDVTFVELKDPLPTEPAAGDALGRR